MKLIDFIPLSTIHYPFKNAFVVRFALCNFRCKVCPYGKWREIGRDVELDEVLSALDNYGDKIDGVVLTGCEPLYQKEWKEIALWAKENEKGVKLHTNGYLLVLDEIAGLVDYLVLRILAPMREEIYDEAVGVNGALAKLKKILPFLKTLPMTVEARIFLFDDAQTMRYLSRKVDVAVFYEEGTARKYKGLFQKVGVLEKGFGVRWL